MPQFILSSFENVSLSYLANATCPADTTLNCPADITPLALPLSSPANLSATRHQVPPAKVLVIGGGVAGLSAVGTAKNLGAIVEPSSSLWMWRSVAEMWTGW